MYRITAIAVLLTFATLDESGGKLWGQNSSMWLTGYYPIWSVTEMPPREMNWSGLTHVVHFGINPQQVPPYWSPAVNNAQGHQDSLDLVRGGGWVWPNNSQDVPDSLVKYARLHGVKVLLSSGGIYGAGQQAYDYITQDSVRTQVFVDAFLAFARRHRYAGIEIDYEPPQTREQMSRLIRIMRRGLNRWTPRGILAIAAANGETSKYDLALKDSVEQFNMMMYDMHFTPAYASGNGGPTDVTAFNSPLHRPSQAYPSLHRWNWNYDGTIDGVLQNGPVKWIRDGMPANKIAVGIPFFGYCYRGRTAPGQPRSGVWPQYIPYKFARLALESGGVYHWDSTSKVPWIGGTASSAIGWYVNPGEEFYITFDDSASLTAKIRWAKQLGLGGIMAYELWQGWVPTAPPGQKDPLLRTVVREVGNPVQVYPSGTLEVNPPILPAGGGDVRLTWTSQHALSASIDQGIGEVGTSGSMVVRVDRTTSFLLTLRGSNGATSIVEASIEVAGTSSSGGTDITSRGSIISFVTAPRGAGNSNPEVIRDGVIPPVGSSNPGDQFDTYTDGSPRQEDWIGYTFENEQWIGGLQFQEGMEFADGGWFRSVQVQVHVGGNWQNVENLTISPPYPGRNGTAFEVFGIGFSRVRATGVRLVGEPGGSGGFISVGELRVLSEGRPADYVLEQNYPNPFNPSTRIHYKLPAEAHVRLSVYNVLGEQIATLVDALQPAGSYITEFEGKGLSAGVYLAVLRANDYVEVRKMVLLK